MGHFAEVPGTSPQLNSNPQMIILLDNISRPFCYSIHTRLDISPPNNDHQTCIYNPQICRSVHNQMLIHHPTLLLGNMAQDDTG
jgi:hypothetical protein